MWVSRYELGARGGLRGRKVFQGFLVRAGEGYGCVHPWPELGDPGVEECLEDLRLGRANTLAERALVCAAADGLARREGRSLFRDLVVPESHATLGEATAEKVAAAVEAGFSVVKVKVGGEREELGDLRRLMGTFPGLNWRVDLNERGEAGLLAGIFGRVEDVDFLEDPFPVDDDWKGFSERTGLRLAADRVAGFADVEIIKPAVEESSGKAEGAWRNGREVVVTSYLDHPLGQCFAAWEAGKLTRNCQNYVDGPITPLLVCGLQSHLVFEETEFSARLGRGPDWVSPGGTGLGFDDLLETLKWMRVR